MRRASSLRFCSGGHFNVSNMWVMLSRVFFRHGLFSTKRAARCWIISSLRTDDWWCGSLPY